MDNSGTGGSSTAGLLVDDLIQLLRDRGVVTQTAEELVDRYAERVGPLVQRFDAERQAKGVGVGWLVTAIRQGYSAKVTAEKLLTHTEAISHNDEYGGPTGRPWGQLFEGVPQDDGSTLWRVLYP